MSWGDAATAPAFHKWRTTAADRYFAWFGVHMSLTFKLFGPVVATTIVLASAMGVIVTNQISSQVETAYDQQADAIAAGAEATFLARPNETAQVDDYLARVQASRPEIVSIRIYGLDGTGSVVASNIPGEVGRAGYLTTAMLHAVMSGGTIEDVRQGGDLVQVTPVRDAGALVGAVVVTQSAAAEDAAVRSIEITIGIAALTSIVVESVFVLSALYLGIIRRTRRMQRAVEAVGQGDTSIRLPEGEAPRGRDEIVNLARSVDKMIVALDERQRSDALIRSLGRRALQGVRTEDLITEALVATRDALGLESCIFASISEDGSVAKWLDGSIGERSGVTLPIWIFALTTVAVEARSAVITDRMGRQSRFAEALAVKSEAQAAIVPLPRTSKAGQAIVAIAPVGETIPEGALAVLDAVAATIAESLHMQAAENARAESAVKSKVMATVSHEMRNPLNSILGFTGLVLGGPADSLSEKQRRQLGFVQSSANNMLVLVNNYLDLAKIRAGSVSLQYETVKIASLVSDVTDAMQPMADAKSIKIATSVSADAEARVDPVRTRQVLANLLSNAVKFTPTGGRVVVRARAADGKCRIAISDTGVGVPKDQRGLLFTEFAKIDAGTMAAGKGTGLGLALTRAFVDAMGGTIKVYSRRGRGTTFVVVLPREASSTQGTSPA